ncbi:unnamed protein product [Blepharisma stoltei]|uniref:Helicase ATP-binding domain-containing protein n=1 Tax=Blepharisma stoltei TaxID=1481888 RepID=A0AAU9IVA3_9CILI|nr:unnamed protein product [Blepharisma stoltei]
MDRKFDFPYDPYKVQLEFMQELYKTLSIQKVGIFESPTGTGKSLSLICSSFKWLSDFKNSSTNEVSEPKIIYTSRTHSQLDQFISEIKKTVWAYGANKIHVVRVGSRKQLCINTELEEFKNSREINYKCKELVKKPENDEERWRKNDDEQNCPYFDGANDVCDHISENICDIEDLLLAGRRNFGCPYYATRQAIEEAEVVIAPYSSILNKRIRKRSKIPLENSILIIDEAHNLTESIISAYSASMQLKQIKQCIKTLSAYYNEYQSRWNPYKSGKINDVLQSVKQFENFIKSALRTSNRKGFSTPVRNFVRDYDLHRYDYKEILEFINLDDLARKVMGYGVTKRLAYGDTTYFYALIEFFECFVNDPTDSCIIFDRGEEVGDPRIKYLLLNPIIPFRSILSSVRCVILAGGTIEPRQEFLELFEDIPKSKITFFSCGHVIPSENLLLSIVSRGKSGNPFRFVFDRRDDLDMMDDLYRLLVDVSQVVPNGIVVFLPSFSFLGKLKNHIDSNYLRKLQRCKQLFYDNRNENILDQYSRYAKNGGAMLFAVTRGKLSEGVNFSDELGRCIIMVGLPYLNCFDIEVKERMNFLDSKLNGFTGREFYEMNCQKAINQSIGRAIRHINDYAIILLVDERHTIYQRPLWMRSNYVDQCEDDPTNIIGSIEDFFEDFRKDKQEQSEEEQEIGYYDYFV